MSYTTGRREQFHRNFDAVMKHVDETGKLSLPKNTNETARLASWARYQFRRTDVLADEQGKIETLRRLFGDMPRQQKNDQAWRAFFEEVGVPLHPLHWS